MITSRTIAALGNTLRCMPDEQRRALLLAAFYGYTAKEISETEGVPLGTAKTRIRMAMLKLRADRSGAAGASVITDCAKMRELAPELALGVLVGAERGEALAHLAGCAECQHLVDELSDAADALLLLAAEAEPSLGFESRVLRALTVDEPRRRPWRWIATAAAAVLLAAAATGIVVHQVDGRSGDLHLRAAELHAPTGKDR